MKVSPARAAAFDILLKIEKNHSFSSVLLPQYEETLSSSDKGLCHELVLGVLRKQIYLDRLIDATASTTKPDTEVRIALRLGLYQLQFLERIPDHSAVNESVEMAVRARKSSAKGLVNAVLRRLSKERPTLQFADELERISVEASHPRWLIEKWVTELGIEDAGKLAHANNRPPPLAFRRTLRGRNVKINDEYRKSRYVEGCWFSDEFDSTLREQSHRHKIYFQDEGSQMVASAVEVPPNGSLLDVCAAPGGKTTAIAMRASSINGRKSGPFIVAGDLYRHRVALLNSICREQGAEFVNFVQFDAIAALPFAECFFDAVLVDAPCSGTGTIRHNPEIRYFLCTEDFPDLQTAQLAILRNASKVVKPGGTLIYSTCSLEREENEDICTRFLTESAEFEPVELEVPSVFITSDGYARTLPFRDDMDGFFIAGFRRV